MALAQRMQLRLPPGSMLARTGGETFAVFCPDLADLEACLTVAGSMHAALAGPLRIDGEDIFTAVSTGVTIGPAEDAESLVHQADIALTRSERLGRSQTVVFEPELDVESQDRLHITRDLRLAIDRGDITVRYQPVVELATGRVRAVEALARWDHPERGMVPPDSFIAVAESTGLISELGAQVLSRACADIAGWNAAGRRLVCAVNASAIQLIDPAFAEHVIERVTSAGLDVKQLTIEITETAAFRDFAAVSRTLDALVARGIKVSLDDFGTGYSSLSVLQRLPVDGLKIDRSFVSGLGGSDEGRIVTGVVQLGLALDLHVVAEGVEAPQQLDFLRQAGCEFGQGYLWSPAVPADRLLATIADIERDLPPVD
jgi:predicted signal transduction protein with EAL and GGDEF domain